MAQLSATALSIPEVIVVQSPKFRDHRGYFVETYSRRDFQKIGIAADFVQDNQSFSARRGTLRGLHFQRPPHPQGKLVRVLRGSIFDVAVDLRCGSPTYGKWCSQQLTADQECDAGIVWDDPLIAINWPVTAADVVLSTKDAKLPRLADFTNPFVYAKRYE